jgi:hypothetical protein
MVGAIIGGVLSAVGQVAGGMAASKARARAARYASDLHRYQGFINKRRLDQVADDILYDAEFASQEYIQRGVADVGKYRTASASAGVGVETGSAAHTQMRGKAIATAEAAMVLINARKGSDEYRRKGMEELRLSQKQAALAGQTGDASSIASYFGAAGSLIQGASRAGFFDGED